MRWGLRKPPAQQQADRRLEDAAAADPVADVPRVRWSGGSALASRGAAGVLWLLLLAGPAGLVVGGYALLNVAPPVQAALSSPDLSGERAAAGELAQRAVVAWLTTPRGQEDRVGPLLPAGYVAPRVPFTVDRLAVSSAEPALGGVWSVTVAATVGDAKKHVQRQYFQVPVRVSGQGGSVAALPAVVAGPAVTPDSPPRYRQPLPQDGPVGTTVSQFLAALIAGRGDVTRYVAPGETIRPVDPAPFRLVKVVDLDAAVPLDETRTPVDGTESQLLVGAAAVAATGQELPLTYTLTVRARAGRWEVARVDLSPVPPPPGGVTPSPSPGSSSPVSSPAPPSGSVSVPSPTPSTSR